MVYTPGGIERATSGLSSRDPVGPSMRRLMALAVAVTALALLGTGAPAVAEPPTAVDGFNSCGYYPSTTVHLRTGPSVRYSSLGLLGPADSVYAEKEARGWYRVRLAGTSRTGLKNGAKGWLAKKHIRAAVCTQLD